MKKIVRIYIIDVASLYLISRFTEGIVFAKGWESLLLAGAGLSVASLIIRPLINLLLLPLNLVTFGLFRWVSSASALYLVTLLVPGFTISRFFFAGLATQWFSLPPISLGGILAYVAISFLLSVLITVFSWLIK